MKCQIKNAENNDDTDRKETGDKKFPKILAQVRYCCYNKEALGV